MESEEGVKAADESAPYEDSRRSGVTGGIGLVGGAREGGDLVIVEFDDGWVNPYAGKEFPHDVAHAARRSAEDYHRVLGYQPLDFRLGRFLPVDR